MTLARSSKRATVTAIKTTIDDPELVERRRAQLTQATIACFSENGYHSTTIRDVAEHAEVSIGLIYQYVGDKEDLLFLALQEVLQAYQRQIPLALKGVNEPLQRLRVAVRTHCRINGDAADATVLAYRETKSLRRERRDTIKQKEIEANALIAACVQDCIKSSLFRNIDVDMFVYQTVMFSHAWALKAWHFAKLMDVDTYVDRGLSLMLRGVLTDAGERILRVLESEPDHRNPSRNANRRCGLNPIRSRKLNRPN